MEHCLTHTSSHNHPEGNELEKGKLCSVEQSELSSAGGGGFDCNICLDSVQDPVLTLCGHLYCWPCIYKWIHLQSGISPEVSEQQPPQCPVCKSEVSESTLVPLYGRVKRSDDGDEKNSGSCVPRRPKGPLVAAAAAPTTTSNNSAQQLNDHPGRPSTYGRENEMPYLHPPYVYGSSDEYTTSFPQAQAQAQAISFAGSTTFHPVISMFGKMISPRSFGDHQMFHANPTSYSVAATSNSRGRRQVVQAHRSLSRLSLFFWCCLVLCLLLF